MMKYKPNRGGHAPGFLRDAFQEWVEEGDQERKTVIIDDEKKPLNWLLGQLWNCTDILPGCDCMLLDIPSGSTYAQAVRSIRHFETEDLMRLP